MTSKLTGRYVWVDGDIYQITRHLSARNYLARFHAGYNGDAEETEPEVIVTVSSYIGDSSLWPFDGDTLTGTLFDL